MAYPQYYPSADAAAAALADAGFTLRESGYWGKRGMTQGNMAEAPYERLALVEIVRHRVAPEYGKPDFYEWRFL